MRFLVRSAIVLATALTGACARAEAPDVLFLGGTVYDGSGRDPSILDVAVIGDRISFVGDAEEAGVEARDTVDATGLMVTPGFIDMHSHVDLEAEYGRGAEIFLYQGITTAVVGVDGAGSPDQAATNAVLAASGIGVNALSYVGHGAVRRRVLGMDDRAPTPAELEEMVGLVRQGMDEGAFGLSSGLFYVPGFYAETEEAIELAKVAAEYGGIYDTQDRDLGAAYRGIGYLNSIREAIRIGEESGTRVIFSHFNAQGRANYGRADEGAALIDSARARGLEVAGAQHVYTATMSSLRAYAVPRWAAAGGAEQILFADPRPDLNGKTLAEVAAERERPVPEVVRDILAEDNAWVMNLELYDLENTRFLATRPWMMTCTDGATPLPG